MCLEFGPAFNLNTTFVGSTHYLVLWPTILCDEQYRCTEQHRYLCGPALWLATIHYCGLFIKWYLVAAY